MVIMFTFVGCAALLGAQWY